MAAVRGTGGERREDYDYAISADSSFKEGAHLAWLYMEVVVGGSGKSLGGSERSYEGLAGGQRSASNRADSV